MKKILLSICTICLIVSVSFSQQFEGNIHVVKKTLSDTLYYTYSIKNKLIRIDEYDKYQKLQKSIIINTKDSIITAIQPNEKLFVEIDAYAKPKQSDNGVQVINSGVFKYIHGYKCYQWRVKNSTTNTETTYWMAKDNFSFFLPLASLTAHLEDTFSAFLLLPIPSIQGQMPMLIETRTLLRVEKSTVSVTKIQAKPIDSAIFKVPNNYQNFHAQR